MRPPDAVWDGVLRRLGTELPEYALQAWIRPLVPELGERGLRLLAPSVFHAERVRSAYLARIGEALCKELEREVPLRVEVGRGQPVGREPGRAPAPPGAPSGAAPLRGAGAHGGRDVAQPPTQHALPLDQSFASFVVGPPNALAREASYAIARGRQLAVSPLFLTGPSGNGKTHLARALVGEARGRDGAAVVYLSAEAFTTRLLASIRTRRTGEFKRSVRSCRLFVLEDVQFLEGKKATQLELFHTLEHLRSVGAGVVMTGDRMPAELRDLEPRLRSQIGSGLVAEIESPDAALRREILRRKAAAGGVGLPEDCLDLLVGNVRGSVRDVEGVLVQLVTTAALLKRSIDVALTEAALRKLQPQRRGGRALAVTEVVNAVAGFYGTTPEAMASRSRRRDVLLPRQIAMYLCHRFTDASISEIAAAFGRAHPAARNAIEGVERSVLERAPLRYRVEALVERLEGLRGGAG